MSYLIYLILSYVILSLCILLIKHFSTRQNLVVQKSRNFLHIMSQDETRRRQSIITISIIQCTVFFYALYSKNKHKKSWEIFFAETMVNYDSPSLFKGAVISLHISVVK